MPSKTLISIGILVGSTIGGYIPILFGADFLSFSSLLASGVGAIIGLYLASRIRL